MHRNEKTVEEYKSLGFTYLAQKKFNEAIDAFTKVLMLDPKDAIAYDSRGRAYQSLGRLNKAIADYTKSLELVPNNAVIYNNRGYAYQTQRKYSEAMADYDKALALGLNNAVNYRNRGNAFRALGKYDEAIDAYTKSLALDSNNAEIYNERGCAYQAQKNFNEAIADFAKSLELVPNNTDVYKNHEFARYAQRKLNDKDKEVSAREINIQDLKEIRIIVNKGRGFGHQRAALQTMLRIRELGFAGRFDVRYEEFYSRQDQAAGYMGRNLEVLIPGFKAASILLVCDQGKTIISSTLGRMAITRLPDLDSWESYRLPPVKLTISGADDISVFKERLCFQFNTDAYIQLQPTDWHRGEHFVITDDAKQEQELPKNLRLSANPLLLDQSIQLADNLVTILRICENKNLNTQLVYGLYSLEHPEASDPTIIWKRLIEAHLLFQSEYEEHLRKKSVIFFPQDIFYQLSLHFEGYKLSKIILCVNLDELKDLDLANAPNIIMVYTGKLSPQFFETLMLEKTSLPPVIEGCNNREACEFMGRPFIHGGAKHASLKIYQLDEFFTEQALHACASECLLKETKHDVRSLVQYMKKALEGELNLYTQARREAFLARPDACYYALNCLSIKTNIDHMQPELPTEMLNPEVLVEAQLKPQKHTVSIHKPVSLIPKTSTSLNLTLFSKNCSSSGASRFQHMVDKLIPFELLPKTMEDKIMTMNTLKIFGKTNKNFNKVSHLTNSRSCNQIKKQGIKLRTL